MEGNASPRIDYIEADVKSHMVCSNLNRVFILHLLGSSPGQEMQAEGMAYRLGLSHRTILYHLDVLHDFGLVEVRKFRRRGAKLMRSVWGLNRSSDHLDKVMHNIRDRFDNGTLESMVARYQPHQ